jgi:hypothetical protein
MQSLIYNALLSISLRRVSRLTSAYLDRLGTSAQHKPLDSLKWHRAATHLSIISIQSLPYESFQFEKFIHFFFSPVAYYSDKA